MTSRVRVAWLTAILLAAFASFAVAQPVPGFIEEFSGTSLGGFTGGAPLSNPGTGGFLGAGDGYLKIATISAANFGANSSLSTAFAGDYNLAGVTEIRVAMNDVGADEALEMHLAIGNTSNFWQYNVGFAPPNGSWGVYIVPLNGPAGWTQISGVAGTFLNALQTADRILLRHDLAPYVSTPNTIKADVGIDHIELRGSPTPTVNGSWGRLKSLYR
jgi:hypothetical protein